MYPNPPRFVLHSRLVPPDFSQTAAQQNKWWHFLEAAHPKCHFGALDIAGRQVGCRSRCSTVKENTYRSCVSVGLGELKILDIVAEVLFTAALSLGIEVGYLVCLGHSINQERIWRLAQRVQVIQCLNSAQKFLPLSSTNISDKDVALANHWYCPFADFPRLSPDSSVLTDDPSLLMTSQALPNDGVGRAQGWG